MGMKTYRFENGSEKHEVKFNFSEDADARLLQDWFERIAETELVQIEKVWIYVIHDLNQIDIDPVAAGVHVVVSGHSHQPSIEERGSVMYVNPGSAGPRRFRLPIAAAELIVTGRSVSPRTVELDGESS